MTGRGPPCIQSAINDCNLPSLKLKIGKYTPEDRQSVPQNEMNHLPTIAFQVMYIIYHIYFLSQYLRRLDRVN